jgi:hypothetical protein
MNAEILKKISTDKLLELQEAVRLEMLNRMDYSVRAGRCGTFIDSATGGKVHVIIKRVNTKTLTCVELDDSITPGSTWKVGKYALTMDGIRLTTEQIKLSVKCEKPSASYDVESW